MCLSVVVVSTCIGTATSIAPVVLLAAQTQFITLAWKNPVYTPIFLRVRVSCRLLCCSEPYLTAVKTMPEGRNEMTVRKLRAGSVCKLHFLAVFNTAGFDRGMSYSFETLETGEPYLCRDICTVMKKTVSSNNWSARTVYKIKNCSLKP